MEPAEGFASGLFSLSELYNYCDKATYSRPRVLRSLIMPSQSGGNNLPQQIKTILPRK